MYTNRRKINVISVLFYMWTLAETQKQKQYCGTKTPVLSICNGGELYNKTSVFINTDHTPFQDKPCLCTITSAHSVTPINIVFFNVTNRSNIKNFKIRANDVVLNSSITEQTTFTGDIKLVIATRRRYVKGGVCLNITPGRHLPTNKFNITCAKQGTPNIAENYGSTTSHAVPIVLSVTGVLLLVAIVVIVHVVIKRYRMAQKSRTPVDPAPSSSEHAGNQGRNTYVSGVDHYLSMHDNVCKINKNEKCSGYRSSVLQHGEESYELVGVCNNLVVSSRSHIYESMHAPVESRSYSKTFENSR